MATTDAPSVLRRVLAREAKALAAGRRLPIDLREILGELRLDLIFAPMTAHGLLRRQGPRWQVVVRSGMAPLRQRFTIAHEVGHYVVESRLDFRPTSPREYWMLEEECQAFAAALLMPDPAIEHVQAGKTLDTSSLIDAVLRLADLAEVAPEAAARRLIEHLDRPIVIALIDAGAARDSGTVCWLHGELGSMSAGRGQRIKRGHRLAVLADVARTMEFGHRRSLDFGPGDATVLKRHDTTALIAFNPAPP